MAAALGGIISGASSQGGQLQAQLGQAISTGIGIQRNNVSWRRQKKVLQNQIRWRVADLRAAGLNPILAAGSGLGGGGASPPVQPSIPDFGAGASAGSRAGSEAARNRSQIEANNANAAAQKAQAERQREGVNTEKAQQAALNSQAAYNAANSLAAQANANLMNAKAPAEAAISQLWTDPKTRKIMAGRAMGGNIGAGIGAAATATPWVQKFNELIQRRGTN